MVISWSSIKDDNGFLNFDNNGYLEHWNMMSYGVEALAYFGITMVKIPSPYYQTPP